MEDCRYKRHEAVWVGGTRFAGHSCVFRAAIPRFSTPVLSSIWRFDWSLGVLLRPSWVCDFGRKRQTCFEVSFWLKDLETKVWKRQSLWPVWLRGRTWTVKVNCFEGMGNQFYSTSTPGSMWILSIKCTERRSCAWNTGGLALVSLDGRKFICVSIR